MSDIDFENGFLCGMATKGLVRSGELYKPLIWNDEGVYTYFYIDFRRAMEPFSTGMWNESVVIHDSEQIKATGVELVSMGVYKIICDISDRPHGITVLNKKVSRLRFSAGERIPVFSIHMFIAGQAQYIDVGYAYDFKTFPALNTEITEVISDFTLWTALGVFDFYEDIPFIEISSEEVEAHSIALT
ncbi:hypothetical protein SDC9_64415 [bioreactor metagenome]|uniref:Uncharacterized protein n=1 Tax=bioreactor metagenome TaxID=1076179 RepID=A0A644XV63_9ZZZZ